MNEENFEVIEQKLKGLKKLRPNQTWKRGLYLIIEERTKTQKENLGNLPRFGLGFGLVSLLLLLASFQSAKSLPGETLYPVKKNYENLKVAGSDEKLLAQQELAKKRIEELKKVVYQERREVKTAIAEVASSISAVQTEVREAKTEYTALKIKGEDTAEVEQSFEQISPSLTESRNSLTQIKSSLTAEEQEEIENLINSVDTLRTEVETTILDRPAQ